MDNKSVTLAVGLSMVYPVSARGRMHGLPDPDTSRAVLIGTSSHTSGLPDLPAVAANVDALAEIFCSPEVWGLPGEHCIRAIDPSTPSEMVGPVADAANTATDTLLVYYAGHGLLSGRFGALHLALRDTHADKASYTAVPFDLIREQLVDAAARRVILILDCCYSGRALGGRMTDGDVVRAAVDQVSAEGTYVLTSSAENHTSLADPTESHTAFTGELLTVLRDGIAGEGPYLHVDSIYQALNTALRAKNRPLPQRRIRSTPGHVPLVRNRAYTQPSGTITLAKTIRTNRDVTKPQRAFDLPPVRYPFIRLLGPVGITGQENAVPLHRWGTRCLLAVLGLNIGVQIDQQTLADHMWRTADQTDRSLDTIRAYARQIQNAIKAAGGNPDLLQYNRHGKHYVLNVDPNNIDYYRFKSLAAAAREREDIELFQQALAVWPREDRALANITDNSWAEYRRNELQAERRDVSLELLDLLQANGHHTKVAKTLMEMLDHIIPTDRVLVLGAEALAYSGNHTAIPAWIKRVTLRMRDTVDVEPSPMALAHANRLASPPSAR